VTSFFAYRCGPEPPDAGPQADEGWTPELGDEIADMFAALCQRRWPSPKFGFHRESYLDKNRTTTQDRVVASPAERAAKRKALEQKRRAYKTAKQREYDRARAAARRAETMKEAA
jgi:hypothetical protein